MWQSRFTEAYGVELPFVSAGMGLVALPELAAAVSNAGGLGMLGVGSAPPAALRQMIAAVRALTSKPFGVNLIVDRMSFGPASTEEHIEACVAERVPAVVFHWNRPPVAWLAKLRAAGIRTWMTIGSVASAREAAAAGFDALVAQGSEAGGHNRSTLGLAALVPAVVDAVTPLPVIAAGGIADGRGVAAALALGADAVCVGTRLVASRESFAHDEYKRRIVAASADDSVRTAIFGPEWPDQPMKVLRNRVVAEWAAASERTPKASELRVIGRTRIGAVDYSMPRFSAVLPTRDTTGDFEEMCLAAGESAGLVRDVRPAGEIVRGMMDEARAIAAGRLAGLVRGVGA